HKNRLRVFNCTFQFGMILYTDEERMRWQLYNLNQATIRIFTTRYHTGLLKTFQIFIVELPAVTMSFTDGVGTVNGAGQAIGFKYAGISPQSHGTALFGNLLLFFHKVDYGFGRVFVH